MSSSKISFAAFLSVYTSISPHMFVLRVSFRMRWRQLAMGCSEEEKKIHSPFFIILL